MGFFSSFNPFKAVSRIVAPVIKNPIKAVTKTAAQIVKDPVRYTAGVATGGLSELARSLPVVGKAVKQGTQIASGIQLTAANALTGGLSGIGQQTALSVLEPRRDDMALNVGGILQSVGQIFGSSQLPVFQNIGNVANLASQFVPQPIARQAVPTSSPVVQTMAVAGPAMRAVATVGRGFFNKYPNLATALQGMRNMGRKVTRAQLYSMMKRFGPEFMVTGGILTAAAVNELLIAGPGRRRMNPGNVTALRRSMRRLESFHKLCVRADSLKRRSRLPHKRRSTACA